MIDAYSWPTPNGHKIHIMLEETELPYRLHPIDIGSGDQFRPEFLKISPNNKIPAIIDQSGPASARLALAESGAILIYLAEKSGQLMPPNRRDHYQCLQWLIFQMAHIGPMLGQAHHFLRYAPERISYGIERYTNESNRLYGILDGGLAEHKYIVGDDYSIADIATFPRLRSNQKQGVNLGEYPNVKRWLHAIQTRPAVQRGLEVMKSEQNAPQDEKARFENLFGDHQLQRR